MYEIYLETRAERDLKKLEPSLFNPIITQIKKLSHEPRPNGCRKITGSKNDWRIRIGNYRVIYEIDETARQVKIMRVKHRREAYRF
ncbi:MAG: type II toxin-antitoxin system RelE/ParE family toxin [Nitrospinae bacterium]|nr:type II toxin-antitoxin system RelE/ParE family toxin [Nitrospinota bacterium]